MDGHIRGRHQWCGLAVTGQPAPRRAKLASWRVTPHAPDGLSAGSQPGSFGFARFPIWLYRARLALLPGSRLLMLEHIGRRSGTKGYVVLEVVHRPAPGCYAVASGFGNASQWYPNVLANPHIRV